MPHIITLVHGTFAKRAAWCQLGSPLHCAILTALGDDDVILHPFDWSAGNSFLQRQQAVRNLITHIRNTRANNPKHRLSVIAHSHGGNILVKALADSSATVDSAICLATPFLVTQSCAAFKAHEKPALLVFTVAAFTLIVSPIMFFLRSPYISETERSFYLVLAVAILTFNFGGKISHYLDQRIDSISARLLDGGTANFDGSHKVLILRSPRDEASLFLGVITGVITFGYWLTETIREIVSVPSTWWYEKFKRQRPAMVLLSFVALLLLHFAIFKLSGSHVLYSYLALGWSLLIYFLLSLGFLMANSLLSLGFGFDVFFGAWRTRLSVEATPPGFWNMYSLKDDPDSTQMRHSLPYSSEEAIRVIVSWLTQDHNEVRQRLRSDSIRFASGRVSDGTLADVVTSQKRLDHS